MSIALGNATQLGYTTIEGNPPGWRTQIWKGVAIVDGNPAAVFDILDNRGQPLVIPA
jgi:hypothetical protein